MRKLFYKTTPKNLKHVADLTDVDFLTPTPDSVCEMQIRGRVRNILDNQSINIFTSNIEWIINLTFNFTNA